MAGLCTLNVTQNVLSSGFESYIKMHNYFLKIQSVKEASENGINTNEMNESCLKGYRN